jgi:hypothetical protein
MSRGGRLWSATQHDVLGGRGVSVSQHAGNERFRALVYARADADYCNTYTTEEKKAVAEEIVDHISSLDPPGRFLKRPKGYGSSSSRSGSSAVDGPWEEISRNDAIKKTCQALRDCNRRDRTGYGASVAAKLPPDVAEVCQTHAQSGMTKKQLAEQAAETSKRKAETQFVMSSQEGDRGLPAMVDFETPGGLDSTSPNTGLDHHLNDGSPIGSPLGSPIGVARLSQSSLPSPKKQRLLPEVTPGLGTVAAPAAALKATPEQQSPLFESSVALDPLPGFVLASTFDEAKPRASSFDTETRPRGASLLGDLGDEDAYAALADHEFGQATPPYEPALNDFDDDT